MAYLNTTSFTYDGKSLDQFNAVIAWFGDNQDELMTGLTVNLERGEQNAVRTNPNLYGAVYDDTLKFEFGIMPGCGKNDFTFEESRAINNWLRHSNGYRLLRFADDLSEQIDYYAVCTDIQDICYNGRNGKKLVFTCNSPFGYTPEIINEWTNDSGDTFICKVFNNSDNGIYYPIVKMELAYSHIDITLTNKSDNNKSAFISLDNTDIRTIILDSENGKIMDENGVLIPAYVIGWDDMNNIYWPRLVDGWNEFECHGASLLSFKSVFPRKAGIL